MLKRQSRSGWALRIGGFIARGRETLRKVLHAEKGPVPLKFAECIFRSLE